MHIPPQWHGLDANCLLLRSAQQLDAPEEAAPHFIDQWLTPTLPLHPLRAAFL